MKEQAISDQGHQIKTTMLEITYNLTLWNLSMIIFFCYLSNRARLVKAASILTCFYC